MKFPLFITHSMFTKSFSLLAAITVLTVCGCASDPAPAETTSTPPAVKGAETAARFVVGKVVGTPAKVAMAAGRAAEVVEKKVTNDPD